MTDLKSIEEYDRMHELVKTGKITQDQWNDFCFELLAKILEDNKDVLHRLRNRD